MVPAPCECGCDATTGECATCPEETEVVEDEAPPVTNPPAEEEENSACAPTDVEEDERDPSEGVPCTYVREGFEQYEFLGCLPGQTCDLETRTCLGEPEQRKRDEAVQYCEDLVYEGHDDWVLPTIDQQKVLFVGCDSVPMAWDPHDEEFVPYSDESCPVAHGCSYFGGDANYFCGCDNQDAVSTHGCWAPYTCSTCERLQGPGLGGYYTAPGYFGVQPFQLSCHTNPFVTRTKEASPWPWS